ncbi:hypothetical protein AAFF_G00404110 [Aldrovandia affinis]|uniref:Peptidase aspartic putative domain-containing protein n=1 Tax=Aldrovandia affinis TaxID=143900 RepID=A0AAD7T7G5_9TELE|nr:hypothetical protein AAFF_G00404110 [Aldrovandia affinis]
MREYYRWRKDWESLQQQGDPSGSPEVKKFQLLESVEETIVKDLRLASHNTAKDVFRVLENRFGNKNAITILIVAELQKISPVKSTNSGRSGLLFKEDPKNSVQPESYFDALLDFLQKQERILEQLEQMEITEFPEKKTEKKFASTRATERGSTEDNCVLCENKHRSRLFTCKKFRGLDLAARKAAVKKSRACRLCLSSHGADGECNLKFLCTKKGCKKGERQTTITFSAPVETRLRKKVRRVFTNKTAVTSCTEAGARKLLEENGVDENPVIMMLLKVTANDGQQIGALIDLASDTNYITHAAASRLGLKSEKITLVVQGVGGMTVTANTKAEKILPEVKTRELVPPRRIELLISQREGRLVPCPVKVVGDLVLWEGPLGKIVSGTHPNLFEDVETVTSRVQDTLRTINENSSG